MKNPEHVAELLAELRTLAETDFERHRIDVLERDLAAPPQVEVIDERHQQFNGVIYYEQKSKNGHYSASRPIHRDIWQYHNGEIPDGYIVHHIDENPANNALENLRLMTQSEHILMHNICGYHPSKKKKLFVCEYCGKIFEAYDRGRRKYCSTSCAQKAHEPHRRRPYKKTCAHCGKPFETRKKKQQFCSHHCAMKYRWKKD